MLISKSIHKHPLVQTVFQFLKKNCSSDRPFLLALSGGIDSLCLFYCLLHFKSRTAVNFHIAHIDHGWRRESKHEAKELKLLADNFAIPFFLKALNPSLLKGNLENACRYERYQFFKFLNEQHHYQGVLTGHHSDDLCETTFKRICEGAHWSKWNSIKAVTVIDSMTVLRPLLDFSKRAICKFMDDFNLKGFEDLTNYQTRFLRAKLRIKIFPWLSKNFGKEIQRAFEKIAHNSEELCDYFDRKLGHYLSHARKSRLGVLYDFQNVLPIESIEINYLIRLIANAHALTFSREIITQMTRDLLLNKANQKYFMNQQVIWVDRQRLFFPFKPSFKEFHSTRITIGTFNLGNWKVNVQEIAYDNNKSQNDWLQVWNGKIVVYLPIKDFLLSSIDSKQLDLANLIEIKKKLNEKKIPASLWKLSPIVHDDKAIVCEFLTGKDYFHFKENERCLKMSLEWIECAEEYNLKK